MGHTLNDYLYGRCSIEQVAHDVTGMLNEQTTTGGALYLLPSGYGLSLSPTLTLFLAPHGKLYLRLQELVPESESVRLFLVNLVAGLIAYCHQPKKPSLGLQPLALPGT